MYMYIYVSKWPYLMANNKKQAGIFWIYKGDNGQEVQTCAYY